MLQSFMEPERWRKKSTRGGEGCDKRSRWEQGVQIRGGTKSPEKRQRESCIKGHEHDSDMHDICENIASAHWWDRWDTEAVFFLTFDYQSVAIFHRAGNFSGRQRAGGTLGPLQRGREGWRDERRKCLCNLLLILLTQHKTLNDLLKSLHMKNVSFWIKSCNVTVLESELSWI